MISAKAGHCHIEAGRSPACGPYAIAPRSSGEAELRSGGQGQDLPSEVGKNVAQDAATALCRRQGIESSRTLAAPDWSRASVISPAGPGKSRARWRNDDSVKGILPYLLLELVSLSRVREIYPGLALDIDAKHLQVEALCSAELLQAALHIPLSRYPREEIQNSQHYRGCRIRLNIGRPRSGFGTLRIGCLGGSGGALVSRVLSEAYRAHVSEVALSSFLAASFSIVAEADGMVIGRPRGALARLVHGWLPFLPPFLPPLPLPGLSAPVGGAGGVFFSKTARSGFSLGSR